MLEKIIKNVTTGFVVVLLACGTAACNLESTDDFSYLFNLGDLPYEPFIDTNYYMFAYGDTAAGERIIDAQYVTSSYYNMDETGVAAGSVFGVNFAEAVANAAICRTGGYTDWRLPTIKELYSLILFSGEDVSMEM